MYDLLDLYARAWRADEPVICLDEKSKQPLRDSRPGLPMARGSLRRFDYEYIRSGTCNIFVAVEPRAGRRIAQVTKHRGKADFVRSARHLIDGAYRSARRIHLVVDNLSTHLKGCFVDTLGADAARQLLRRVVFHQDESLETLILSQPCTLGGNKCMERLRALLLPGDAPYRSRIEKALLDLSEVDPMYAALLRATYF